MPNGGSDNCRWCKFNGLRETADVFVAFCRIRNVRITIPLCTYCANYHTGSDVPDGPIFCAGHDYYHRIPWNGKYRPKLGAAGLCSVCSRQFMEKGIEVQVSKSESKQFCGDHHYLKWWKENHPGIHLMWDIKDE